VIFLRPARSALFFSVLVMGAGCTRPPPRMCASAVDCGDRGACVSGRCLPLGATAAVNTARRLLFAPVDVAYVHRGAGARESATAVLGSADDRDAMALLRFSVPLPPEANVIEAYLLLERPMAADSDPAPIVLRPARVVDSWDSRSVSWARQPRLEDVGAPLTRVAPSGGPLVRLDIRGLLQRWRRRAGGDFGVAVVAEEPSRSGMAFALAPVASADPRADLRGPRLELYVK
jgi:hypothetical protein